MRPFLIVIVLISLAACESVGTDYTFRSTSPKALMLVRINPPSSADYLTFREVDLGQREYKVGQVIVPINALVDARLKGPDDSPSSRPYIYAVKAIPGTYAYVGWSGTQGGLLTGSGPITQCHDDRVLVFQVSRGQVHLIDLEPNGERSFDEIIAQDVRPILANYPNIPKNIRQTSPVAVISAYPPHMPVHQRNTSIDSCPSEEEFFIIETSSAEGLGVTQPDGEGVVSNETQRHQSEYL